ncbi:beta-N-acetylhexosaminidase, partial [Coprobacter fastidiosus]
MAKKLVLLFFLSLFLSLPLKGQRQEQITLQLIPYPQKLVFGEGTFFSKNPDVVFSGTSSEEEKILMNELRSLWSTIDRKKKISGKDVIFIQKIRDGEVSVSGGYDLEIRPERIIISANNDEGLFYGVQTLNQIMVSCAGSALPCLKIEDYPRFPYRGMHLDVSRHFFDTEFIKKQFDVIASYKLNRFHWHLTDGAGWRIQIKEYPLLTEVAAWRPAPTWKEWWNGNRHYCRQDVPGAYGGFYTREDIKDVLEYARSKHITVIPEIEMPGHSEEVLAVYPDLSCSGKPYKNGELCIGNENTFKFLETVLDEVISLFPSKYIHIGGDEANKEAWKKCPKCQQRMKDEGLKSVDELQSYLVHRIEKYLNSKGRELLGWDEILDGGLSPNATVMSWRGEKGGIQAVRMGHDAIMTPGEYCYFDAYQDNPSGEPEAIGGYLPLKKVYSYNPVPDSLTLEESKRILGVQANLWVEYISTQKHVEYMLYPRLLALSEVAWSNLENKSWTRFRLAANRHVAWLWDKRINAHPIANGVVMSQIVDTLKREIRVSFECDRIPSEIRYTLDGSEPTLHSTLYSVPVSVKDSAEITVALFGEGKQLTRSQKYKVYYHKGIGAKVTYKLPYSDHYKAACEHTLTDGHTGGNSYGDGKWQGFSGDMDCIIDLGKITDIH